MNVYHADTNECVIRAMLLGISKCSVPLDAAEEKPTAWAAPGMVALVVDKPWDVVSSLPWAGTDPFLQLQEATLLCTHVPSDWTDNPFVEVRPYAPKGGLTVTGFKRPDGRFYVTGYRAQVGWTTVGIIATDLAALSLLSQFGSWIADAPIGGVSYVCDSVGIHDTVDRYVRDPKLFGTPEKAGEQKRYFDDTTEDGANEWIREAAMFVENPLAIGYTVPFFKKTAGPVIQVAAKIQEGKMAEAAAAINSIRNPVWKSAISRHVDYLVTRSLA